MTTINPTKIALKLKVQAPIIQSPTESSIIQSLEPKSELLETKFQGIPLITLQINTHQVQIFKTLKGDGLWITGETKELSLKFKGFGGLWVNKMLAWLFPLEMKYAIIPYLTDLALNPKVSVNIKTASV